MARYPRTSSSPSAAAGAAAASLLTRGEDTEKEEEQEEEGGELETVWGRGVADLRKGFRRRGHRWEG